MTNPENSGAIKQEEPFIFRQQRSTKPAQGNEKFSIPETLYTFLCKSGERFILDTFVYITLGIDSQTDSLCTRKYEIRAIQYIFMLLFYQLANSQSLHAKPVKSYGAL